MRRFLCVPTILCFEQKHENGQTFLTENCDLYSREKSLYIAWECFRNVLTDLSSLCADCPFCHAAA